MQTFRKPKPVLNPTTAAEMIIDLDSRLEGGDALCDVWVPHEEWAGLCEQAMEEKNAELAQGQADERLGLGRVSSDWMRRMEHREADFTEALGLGLGKKISTVELLEIVRGEVMAREIERRRILELEEELSELLAEQAKRKHSGLAFGEESRKLVLAATHVLYELRAEERSGEVAKPGIWAALTKSLEAALPAKEEQAEEPKGVTGPACEFCEEVGHTRAECGVAPKEEDFEDRAAPVPKPFKTGLDSPLSEKKPDRYCQRCSQYHPKGEHRVPKADKKPAELPYMVRVGGKVIGPPSRYGDRNAAVASAKSLGHVDFEVIDDAGTVWDSVKVEAKKKGRRMPMHDVAPAQEEAPF